VIDGLLHLSLDEWGVWAGIISAIATVIGLPVALLSGLATIKQRRLKSPDPIIEVSVPKGSSNRPMGSVERDDIVVDKFKAASRDRRPVCRFLVTARPRDGALLVFSTANGEKLSEFRPDYHFAKGTDLRVHGVPGTGVILVGFRDLPNIVGYDAATGRELFSHPHRHIALRSVHVSPRGDLFVTLGVGDVRVWRTRTRELIDQFECDYRSEERVSISLDSRLVMVESRASIVLRDVRAKRSRKRWDLPHANSSSIALTEQKDLLVSRSGFVEVLVPNERLSINVPGSPIRSQNFGNFVYFPSESGVAIVMRGDGADQFKLVDPMSGRQLRKFTGPPCKLNSTAAAYHDEILAMTAGEGDRIHLWCLLESAPTHVVCAGIEDASLPTFC